MFTKILSDEYRLGGLARLFSLKTFVSQKFLLLPPWVGVSTHTVKVQAARALDDSVISDNAAVAFAVAVTLSRLTHQKDPASVKQR